MTDPRQTDDGSPRLVRQAGPGLVVIGVVVIAALVILALSRGFPGRETAFVGQEPAASETVVAPGPTEAPRTERTAEPDPEPTEEPAQEPGPTTEPDPTEVTQTREPTDAGPSAPASAPPVVIDPVASLALDATAEPEPIPSREAPAARGPGEAPWAQVGTDGMGSFTLYVGTVAGQAREVVTRDGWIQTSGPVDGKVLAWWQNGDASTVVLVDTADDSRTTVARPDGNLGEGAALDPSGRFVYMAPYAGDDRIRGLYRMPVEGGELERIADGWEANLARMTWSLDGRWLAISGAKGSEVVHRVLDTRDDTLTAHRGSGIGDPIGFVGDELVGYMARDDGGITKFPLLALDVTTGRVRTVVDGDGGARGAVLPDADGPPVLAYAVPDDRGRYTVRATDGSGSSRLLYSSEDPWVDAFFGEGETSALVRNSLDGGVEAVGFAPVFTGGIPYAWPGGPAYERPTRTMVDLATGEATTFEQRGVQR